ncbi:MAG: argininosuccinate lyase [Polyangiaceae bacterium]|nr:argininosuccinate lyase [Polyangiaceae bacterium]
MTISGGGRLPETLDEAMAELNASVDVDSELWREDIEGSTAHARELARIGVLSADELDSLLGGLDTIREEIQSGAFAWDPALEDVHMNIESRLTAICGAVGGKLHTGRSRNDQVATDLRLWARRRSRELLDAISAMAGVIVDLAERELDTLMPAYTHLQRAQPSRLSHHLLAWQESLWRDYGRLADAVERLDECPLGAGAVAGSGFPLERARVASDLGFGQPMRNSIDATASRDFLIEIACALAILGVHLSRIGEEVVLWSTREFGFLELDDRFTTSSSMMPQKKNPDVAELVRGKSALVIGAATSLLVLEKGLAYGYGRDLQEDKRPIFDACQAVWQSLRALTGALATARFRRDRLQAALGEGHLCATDVADWLACRGVPFRQAHQIVGQLVREAEVRGVGLEALPTEVMARAHADLVCPEVREVLAPASAVERRRVHGGPARERVVEAIGEARERWAAARNAQPAR